MAKTKTTPETADAARNFLADFFNKNEFPDEIKRDTTPTDGKVAFTRYEMRSGGHNKFWEVRVLPPSDDHAFRVEVRWGAIDATPTIRAYDKRTEREALVDASRRVEEKLKRGYKRV